MSENGDRRIDEEEGEIENERDEDEDKDEIRDILDETIHDLRNVDSNLAVMSGEEGGTPPSSNGSNKDRGHALLSTLCSNPCVTVKV